MSRVDIFRMVKRRVKAAKLGDAANCHTLRASGITASLLNGGTLERAQAIAGHESPRTTQLYDRTADDITVEDIEGIRVSLGVRDWRSTACGSPGRPLSALAGEPIASTRSAVFSASV